MRRDNKVIKEIRWKNKKSINPKDWKKYNK
jgi:hypothetical protein